MHRFKKKELPAITWENIRPPYKTYDYFQHVQHLPFRSQADRFDMVNAWWLIESATLAYADMDFAESVFLNAGFQDVYFLDGKSTQCYVVGTLEYGIVAFRGTEIQQDKDTDFRSVVADLLTDLDIRLAPAVTEHGKVHMGFQNAIEEVWRDLHAIINAFQRQGRTVWMTGHSLGAALATLAADRFPDVQGLYTFGSPRVGDTVFSSRFTPRAWRFINDQDVFCRLPPPIYYRHVGKPKFVDKSGGIHDRKGRRLQDEHRLSAETVGFSDGAKPARHRHAGMIPKYISDHLPLLYAIRIWNAISG